MSKIPALTPKKVIHILNKKGFVLDRTKGSHQVYRNPENRKMVVVPYHRKDLPLNPCLLAGRLDPLNPFTN